MKHQRAVTADRKYRNSKNQQNNLVDQEQINSKGFNFQTNNLFVESNEEDQMKLKYESLIKKAQQHITQQSIGMKKEKIFITGIGMKQFIPLKEPEFNESELYEEYKRPYDDLKELRKMIRRTKRNMVSCGTNLYDLKEDVTELNNKAKPYGYNVGDYVFDDMNQDLYRYSRKK